MENSFFLVTPAHNEIGHIRNLIDSVRLQSLLPIVWVIVDDGSTDGTREVINDSIGNNPASGIVLYPLSDPHPAIDKRFVPVTTGISLGLAECKRLGVQPEFVAVVDGDILLSPNYFEEVRRAMETNKGTGIGTGVMFDKDGEKFRPFADPQGRFIFAGAAAVYRFSFLKDIGGYPQSPAADTVAFYRGLHAGWIPVMTTKTRFFHLRSVSSWRRRLYDGRRFHKFGSPLLGAILASAYFTLRGPKRAAGPAYLIGYMLAVLRGYEKLDEPLVLEAYGKRRVNSMITSYLLGRRSKSNVLMM